MSDAVSHTCHAALPLGMMFVFLRLSEQMGFIWNSRITSLVDLNFAWIKDNKDSAVNVRELDFLYIGRAETPGSRRSSDAGRGDYPAQRTSEISLSGQPPGTGRRRSDTGQQVAVPPDNFFVRRSSDAGRADDAPRLPPDGGAGGYGGSGYGSGGSLGGGSGGGASAANSPRPSDSSVGDRDDSVEDRADEHGSGSYPLGLSDSGGYADESLGSGAVSGRRQTDITILNACPLCRQGFNSPDALVEHVYSMTCRIAPPPGGLRNSTSAGSLRADSAELNATRPQLPEARRLSTGERSPLQSPEGSSTTTPRAKLAKSVDLVRRHSGKDSVEGADRRSCTDVLPEGGARSPARSPIISPESTPRKPVKKAETVGRKRGKDLATVAEAPDSSSPTRRLLSTSLGRKSGLDVSNKMDPIAGKAGSGLHALCFSYIFLCLFSLDPLDFCYSLTFVLQGSAVAVVKVEGKGASGSERSVFTLTLSVSSLA
jgi:hypothetical protein